MESVWGRSADQREWKDRDGVESAGVCARRTVRWCWPWMPASERTPLHRCLAGSSSGPLGSLAACTHTRWAAVHGYVESHVEVLLPLHSNGHETWHMKEDFSLRWKNKLKISLSSKILKILQLFQCTWRMKFKQILGLRVVYERLFWNFSIVWMQSEFRSWDKIVMKVISYVPSQALGLYWGSKYEFGTWWEPLLSFHQVHWQTWPMKSNSKFRGGVWTLVWSPAYSSRKQTKLHRCLTEILKWGTGNWK